MYFLKDKMIFSANQDVRRTYGGGGRYNVVYMKSFFYPA